MFWRIIPQPWTGINNKAISINPLTQGEKLYILVFRAKRNKVTTPQIAAAIGVEPEYLPTLYKKDNLGMKLIEKAADFFQVDPALFDRDLPVEALKKELDLMRSDIETWTARSRHLEEELVLLQAQLIKLRRKEKDSETSSN